LRRRTIIIPMLAAALLLAGIASSPPAAGTTKVRSALLERQAVVQRAHEVRRIEARLSRLLERKIDWLGYLRRTADTDTRTKAQDRRSMLDGVGATLMASAERRLRDLKVWRDKRVRELLLRYGSIQRWLDIAGIFRVCPVPSFTVVNDNFGYIVRLPHVPVHVHHGDDITAAAGSPILAPFDGYITTGRSKLGGLELRVNGDAGYVYNAHLSSVARWGWVHAGTVVGYVGATGDATGPHDHLEWHPNGGPAVDPYPLLAAACLPASG
jgi:murein DD-endopeptidase MepM/ murein hydrolase activator NlpD